MNSFVFVCRKIKSILIIFILISFMHCGTLVLAEDDFSADKVKDRFINFVSKEDFIGLMDYFNRIKIESLSPDETFLVEYYSTLTKSLYLDDLEKKEKWQDFYNNMDELDEQIIEAAAKYADAQINSELIDLQYLAQKAYLRDEDEQAAQEVFDNFVNNVISYTEKTGDITKFQEVAKIIAADGRKRHLNQLFVVYKDYLIANNADASSGQRLKELADEYLRAGQTDMAIVIYGHYIDFTLQKYEKAEAKEALMSICDKFRDHGFNAALDADFAEQIYTKLEKSFGPEVFLGTEIFKRGLNLEALGDYRRAQEEYKNCTKKAGQSQFLAEVYTRLGILNIFYQGNVDIGLRYLEKVSTEFADSDYADFCAYQAGLVLQYKKEVQKASEIYNKLINKDSIFSAQAVERKQEIDNETGLKQELADPFDMMFGAQGSNIVMSLKSLPNRGFSNKDILWQATAQDFSVGTIQPAFKYEWFGAKGLNDSPGNVTEFKTTYDSVMPKLVCLIAKTPGSENAICRSVWIHDIIIDAPKVIKVGQLFKCSAKIYPSTIQEEDIQWSWSIQGQKQIDFKGKSFDYVFEQPGRYNAEMLISIKDEQVSKKFSFEVVE